MKVLIVSSYDKSIFAHIDAVNFFEYLINEVGMTKDDIFFYGPAECEAKINFYNILAHICERTVREPLIIYYSGHGKEDGWCFHDRVFIPYGVIAHFLKFRKNQLIFINDCCFGMAAVNFLKELKYQKMVIGLAPKDLEGQTTSSGSFLLLEILRYWRKDNIATPRFLFEKTDQSKDFGGDLEQQLRSNICLRYGDNLDYLLFPKKTTAMRFYRASQIFLQILQLLRELFICLQKKIKPF